MSTHTRAPVEHIVGDDPALTVVLAHGRNRSPDDMAPLARSLGPARYLLLAADDKTWYPKGFMAPFADNEPKLSAAIAHIEQVVSDTLASGVSADRIVVGGFSQGACLAAEYLARHPRRLGAALIFTGGLLGPDGTTWPIQAALQGMPVYLTSAENDDWVPAPRVRETKAWLTQCGAALHYQMFEHREHTISETEINAARELLANL